MARTRMPGIRVDRNGGIIIDKEHRGIPTYVRLGITSQAQPEQRLAHEIDRVDVPASLEVAERYPGRARSGFLYIAISWDRYLYAPRNASIVSARSGNALSTPLSAVTSRTDRASASATNSAS